MHEVVVWDNAGMRSVLEVSDEAAERSGTRRLFHASLDSLQCIWLANHWCAHAVDGELLS